MGIQPIDLQTMYSQLANVSKIAGEQQSAQLTQSMQQQSAIQRDMENARKVKETDNDKASTNNVNSNGKNNDGENNSNKDKKKKDELIEAEKSDNNSKHPYLGTIIDITR